jgi:hypothetical protein
MYASYMEGIHITQRISREFLVMPIVASIEYPFERRNRAEFVWDSLIAWAIVPGAPKLTTTAPMVLPYQSSGIPVHAMPGHNPEIESDSLLILALVSLHSASSHTLLAAPSD